MSQALALLFTVAVMVPMILEDRNIPQAATISTPALEVELAPEPAPPSPPAPRVSEPPAPQPPRPQPVRKKQPEPRDLAPASLPLMAETAETPAATVPAADPRDAEAEAPPAPDRAVAGTVEAQYAATLRTNIDARTVVPDSVAYRLRRPQGETRVNFTLDRAGSVLAASVARTSGSDILDRQAVNIVKAGRYPPFPPAAFRGEARHSFLVTLEFHL